MMVKQTSKGFLVTYDSRVTGTRTGFKALVYFSDKYPKGMDLDRCELKTPDLTNGDRIVTDARFSSQTPDQKIKVLSRGFIVR